MMWWREIAVILFLFSVEILAQVTFQNQPRSASVIEGEDAVFQCAAIENGMPLQFIWEFTPKAGSAMVVVTGTSLVGVTSVTVSADRTQLILGGVRREVNGTTVVCIAAGATSTPRSNAASLAVSWLSEVTPTDSAVDIVEGNCTFVNYTLDEGNPPPILSVSGPSQPDSSRVHFNSTGVFINDVNRRDNGSHTATWRNDAGDAVFALDISVTAPRGPEPLPLNECGASSTSAQTVISEIPGIEFPNPTVDCSGVSGAAVENGILTITCSQFPNGQSSMITCSVVGGGTIQFQLSVAPPACSPGCIAGIIIGVLLVVVGLVLVAVGVAILVYCLCCKDKRAKKERTIDEKPVALT